MESNPPGTTINPSLTFSRGRSQTDDEGNTVSAISTDLSRYMATSLDQSTLQDSDIDSDTTTIAESMFQSLCDSLPGPEPRDGSARADQQPMDGEAPNMAVKSERGSKLIRSASFTVDVPTFTMADGSMGVSQSLDMTDKEPGISKDGGAVKDSDQLISYQRADNAFLQSLLAPAAAKLSAPTDKPNHTNKPFNAPSWTADFLNDQIKRLDDMHISLQRYHRLQLDELITKQFQELETLKMQKEFLVSILQKGHTAYLDRQKTPAHQKSDQPLIKTRPKPSSADTKKRQGSEYFRSHSVSGRSLRHTSIARSPPPAHFATATKSTPSLVSNAKTDQCPAAFLQSLFSSAAKSDQARLNTVATATKSISDHTKIMQKSGHKAIPEVLKSRLAGMVRGYLTRRWLETDRMKKLISTIKVIID